MEEKDLSEHARALWVKSRHAIDLRNYEYALALINAVLKQFPEFLAGRNRLREIELLAAKSGKPLPPAPPADSFKHADRMGLAAPDVQIDPADLINCAV